MTTKINLRARAIIIHDNHLLISQPTNETFWCLPGGQADPGELTIDALIREVHEELGVLIDPASCRLCGINEFRKKNKKKTNIETRYLLDEQTTQTIVGADRSAASHAHEIGERRRQSLDALSDVDLMPRKLTSDIDARRASGYALWDFSDTP